MRVGSVHRLVTAMGLNDSFRHGQFHQQYSNKFDPLTPGFEAGLEAHSVKVIWSLLKDIASDSDLICKIACRQHWQ